MIYEYKNKFFNADACLENSHTLIMHCRLYTHTHSHNALPFVHTHTLFYCALPFVHTHTLLLCTAVCTRTPPPPSPNFPLFLRTFFLSNVN